MSPTWACTGECDVYRHRDPPLAGRDPEPVPLHSPRHRTSPSAPGTRPAKHGIASWEQCCGSMTFWCGSGSGSGSADPCLWLMDPDPSIFIIALQDANKKLISCILLFEGTFTSSNGSRFGSRRPKNMWIRWIRIRNTAWEGWPLPRWRKQCPGIDWQLLREEYGWNGPPPGLGWNAPRSGFGWNGPRLVFGWNGPRSCFGWNGPRLRYYWNGVQLGWNGRRQPGYGWNGPPRQKSCWNGSRVGLGRFPFYAVLYKCVPVSRLTSYHKHLFFLKKFKNTSMNTDTGSFLCTTVLKRTKQLVKIPLPTRIWKLSHKFRCFITKNCANQGNFACKESGWLRRLTILKNISIS